jgi:hypothetical protein
MPRKCNITTSFVPISDLEAVAAAITDKTKASGRCFSSEHHLPAVPAAVLASTASHC